MPDTTQVQSRINDYELALSELYRRLATVQPAAFFPIARK